MSKYRTFRKEKWLYCILAIVVYFVPFIVVTGVFLPIVKVATGYKVAIGLVVITINTIPFLMGIFRVFTSHFPMLNVPAIIFLALSAFFTIDVFEAYRTIFNWIELAVVISSLVSCFLWRQYMKCSRAQNSVKATLHSGAFALKEE